MNHDRDFDRDHDREDQVNDQELLDLLENSLQMENELMRRYIITAERIHENESLRERLENFAQGNAKRTRQLQDEIANLNH